MGQKLENKVGGKPPHPVMLLYIGAIGSDTFFSTFCNLLPCKHLEQKKSLDSFAYSWENKDKKI